jgi:hypothetical protein
MHAGSVGARSRLTSVVAAGALAAAALGAVSAAPANAAVMVSGSTIDAAGNYVEGSMSVYSTAGAYVGNYVVDSGTFDIPLENGSYKLRFYPTPDYTPEWYRDKADEATADVVTVAGAAQTLSPWTIERAPSVTGLVRTADGRAVRNASVQAYDTTTGDPVGSDSTNRDGSFRVGTTSPSVKLVFSGYDPDSGDELATEWYNDKASQATADPVGPTAAGADVGVVTLAPGGSISGRVTNDYAQPIARVQACSNDGCDYTDANGVYTIEGVSTGTHEVAFYDEIGEYHGEYWNNIAFDSPADPTPVTVAPGQAVTGIDPVLTLKPAAVPNGVDVSGTVRDQLGNVGIGYKIDVMDTPADPRDAKVVASTYSNRAGQYHFAQLDRIAGETEFKLVVRTDQAPREEGDFLRRTTWSGNKLGYDTAVVVTSAPRTLDFTLPVSGGVSGAVTSEAGGVPEDPWASFRDAENNNAGQAYEFKPDGTYDVRTLWAGTYTVQFGGDDHVAEWWKDALPEDATTITVTPGQLTTGISAALTKDVKAVERPEVAGDAWVGKTIRLDKGRWNTEARSVFTYEWLAGTTVVGTGPSLKITKSMLGKKVTGRVTNDAGFAQGQAVTATTPKIGYKPKVKAKVSRKSAAITLKVKPLKAKKVKATITVFEIVGVKKNGEAKTKKLGKATIKNGTGVVRFKKALGKGKHKLVFAVKGKGKVGSGDIQKKVKIKR